MNPDSGSSSKNGSSGGTMLRMLGAAQKREVKATQNLAIIVLFFMICWIPLYTTNCVIVFCPKCEIDSTFMLSCIILSHLNSAGNPVLYAYHLKDFRLALKNFLCSLFGKKPSSGFSSQIHHRTINNYSQHSQYRGTLERQNSQILYRKKTAEQIKSIIPGDNKREIWNIPEGSDSSNSFKETDEKPSSVYRPGTPYRTNDISQINQAYVETCSQDGGSDEVFVPQSEFCYDDFGIQLTKNLDCNLKIVPTEKIEFSPPNNLFLVQSEYQETRFRLPNGCERSISVDNSDLKICFDRTYDSKTKLKRSLSDDGTKLYKSPQINGIVIGSYGS